MTASNSTESADVIVIGGGVIGCWTAHYLLDKGCRVTILERDQVGQGASGVNCGYICPSHVMPLCAPGAISHSLPSLLSRKGALSIPMRFDPFLWKWLLRFTANCSARHCDHAAAARHELLQASMQLYLDYVHQLDSNQVAVDVQWEQRGLLLVHRNLRSLDEYQATAEQLETRFGVHSQRLDGSQMRELEPSLIDGLAGGWHFPQDAHLNPNRLMQRLRNSILERGARLVEHTEVLEMMISGGSIRGLKTSSGDFRADQYVLATGAEAPRFAKPLGCQIPIVPGKGYSMSFPSGASSPSTSMIFEDSHVAVTPLAGQTRIGSTMQLMGYDRSVDSSRLKMIRDSAQSYLRDPLPAQPDSASVAWRPMVHDDLPCIDRSPAVRNAFVAAGNGMVGMSTGTGTGRLMAEMVCGEIPFLDVEPFALTRFDRARKPVSPKRASATDASIGPVVAVNAQLNGCVEPDGQTGLDRSREPAQRGPAKAANCS